MIRDNAQRFLHCDTCRGGGPVINWCEGCHSLLCAVCWGDVTLPSFCAACCKAQLALIAGAMPPTHAVPTTIELATIEELRTERAELRRQLDEVVAVQTIRATMLRKAHDDMDAMVRQHAADAALIARLVDALARNHDSSCVQRWGWACMTCDALVAARQAGVK